MVAEVPAVRDLERRLAADVRKTMTILENHIEDSRQIQPDAEKTMNGISNTEPSTTQ
jgi:hypothetical protein